MAGFSEKAFLKKLSDLNNSQQSIQQLSLWLIHHRKHYQFVVKSWFYELGKVSSDRKLTFLYLANDVVQNTRKKHPEYSKEFGKVMKKIMEHLASLTLRENLVKSINRLLTIWHERSIFDSSIQTEIQRIWTQKTIEMAAAATAVVDSRNNDTETLDQDLLSSDTESTPSVSKKIKLNESSLNSINYDPPESEELVKAIQDLENSASSDGKTREIIARLPSEVSDMSQLPNNQEITALLNKVNEACALLESYNDRLQQELVDREKVGKMIVDFLASQRQLDAQAEERLEEYRDKLTKVNTIQEDLKSHIQSLPDLTKLPDVTGGVLAPLPSAGDLFTAK